MLYVRFHYGTFKYYINWLEFKNNTGESEREGGRGTDGLLTSLRRSWRVLDAGDAVRVEISCGGG